MERTTAIHLGKLHNKYLIVEILLWSSQEDALQEGETLLWHTSQSHRGFLSGNHDWYPRVWTFKTPFRFLMTDSAIIKSKEQATCIVKTVPNLNSLELLCRGSFHGWETKTFQERCDNKGRTLVLVRGTNGYVAYAYTSTPWRSENHASLIDLIDMNCTHKSLEKERNPDIKP